MAAAPSSPYLRRGPQAPGWAQGTRVTVAAWLRWKPGRGARKHTDVRVTDLDDRETASYGVMRGDMTGLVYDVLVE